jgi:hypothetical protein
MENDKVWGVVIALFSFIIFLTMAVTSNSFSMRALEAEGVSDMVEGIIPKPVDFVSLFEKIEKGPF